MRRVGEVDEQSAPPTHEETATFALTQHDLILRFRGAVDSGDPARGSELLDKLERQFDEKPTL